MKKYDLKLKYNDIVVINKDKKTIIKRIVGLPNDKIRIDDYLIVNDEQFDDKLINNKGKITEELILKSDEYFVLGDNRDNSIDSRFDEIGIIKEKEIKGKVLFK